MSRLIRYFNILRSLAASRFSKHTVAAGYYKYNNFGDLLTPDVLHLCGLRSVHCPSIARSEVVGVGSLLQMLPESYNGKILGAGLIKSSDKRLPNAKFYLVRGHLSKQSLKLGKAVAVGDPGLLAEELYKDSISATKQFDLGIIPHYVDKENPTINFLIENSDLKITVIDVQDKPQNVLAQVSKCKSIISSSLHGLIFADSLSIPNQWIKLSDKVIGKDFKFFDYYSCFDIEACPVHLDMKTDLNQLIGSLQAVDPNKLELVKQGIRNALDQFTKDYLN